MFADFINRLLTICLSHEGQCGSKGGEASGDVVVDPTVEVALVGGNEFLSHYMLIQLDIALAYLVAILRGHFRHFLSGFPHEAV